MAKIAKKSPQKTSPSKKSGKKALPQKASPRQSEPQVAIGDKVPAVTLPSTGGQEFDLREQQGKIVVLYFYPKDSTPGCTLEGRDFSCLIEKFNAAGAEVFGVSRDTLKSHENFKAKEGYQVDLLSDADEKLCTIFGVVKLKNMYGRQVRGIERSTFVIDREGKLIKEWRGVKVPGHADEVLKFVTELT